MEVSENNDIEFTNPDESLSYTDDYTNQNSDFRNRMNSVNSNFTKHFEPDRMQN